MALRACSWLGGSVLVALALAAGCHRPPTGPATPRAVEPMTPERAMRPVPRERWPDLVDPGERAPLLAAVRESLTWLASQPADRRFVFGPRALVTAELRAGLERFVALLAAEPDPGRLALRLGEEFELVASVGDASGDVLVTGYYEPEIEASLTPGPEHAVPVYRAPPDRLTIVARDFSDKSPEETWVGRLEGRRVLPYWDRAAIRSRDVLAGRGLELAWARDEVDLFFLEVQGSGVLRLAEGGEMRIGYDSANGRSYRSIGRTLIEQGAIPRERMSMQAIRAWLREHPDEVRCTLDSNPSFVFFRELAGSAEGFLGRPVTARRSIATDRRLFPPAALAWLETTVPEADATGALVEGARLAGFVLNQDTGSAIRGPDRVDLFWGRGAEAAERAGLMRNRGRLYFLLPRAR